MASFKDRLVGVLSVDADVFEEIEHDESATGQAAVVVVVAAVLSAIGGGLLASNIATGLIGLLAWGVISWLLWAVITFFIGTKVFDGDATMGQMLRVVGFAYAPSAFNILSFIPFIGVIIPMLVAFWLLATFFVGVRAGLDIGNGKVLITIIVGWFVYLIGQGIVLSIVGALPF